MRAHNQTDQLRALAGFKEQPSLCGDPPCHDGRDLCYRDVIGIALVQDLQASEDLIARRWVTKLRRERRDRISISRECGSNNHGRLLDELLAVTT